jgi:hypothetical protein
MPLDDQLELMLELLKCDGNCLDEEPDESMA